MDIGYLRYYAYKHKLKKKNTEGEKLQIHLSNAASFVL